jgi:hypothetical protein
VLASDVDHSSGRRAADRCIAGAVRESVQLELGVEEQHHCFQRQSIKPRPRDPVLTHRRADDRQPAARTYGAAGGVWEQQSGAATRAPVQAQKQASADSPRDSRNATIAIANSHLS